MNAERRQKIDAIKDRIIGLHTDLEVIRDDEQTAFDNLPEGFQQGEQGNKAQASIDALDEAIEACNSLDDSLDTAKGEA